MDIVGARGFQLVDDLLLRDSVQLSTSLCVTEIMNVDCLRQIVEGNGLDSEYITQVDLPILVEIRDRFLEASASQRHGLRVSHPLTTSITTYVRLTRLIVLVHPLVRLIIVPDDPHPDSSSKIPVRPYRERW